MASRARFLTMGVAILVLCAQGLVGSIPANATPLTPQYAAGGVAASDTGSWLFAYGVNARSRMYAKQSPQDGDWVNSLYARKDDGDFVEAGWYWTPGGSTRTWFSWCYKAGYYVPEDILTNVPVYATDTWPGVAVRRNNPNSDRYDIYIDGVLRDYWTGTGMTSCRASVTSERYDTLDHNKGAWTYALYLNKSYTWVYWPHAARLDFGVARTDPNYRLYTNYIDASNHLVYCDDHMN